LTVDFSLNLYKLYEKYCVIQNKLKNAVEVKKWFGFTRVINNIESTMCQIKAFTER
jgi:hypothetical protein